MAEDQQMKQLRIQLEAELTHDGYQRTVEDRMKALLHNQPEWERGVKDSCLQKIQGYSGDLNNVNIDQLTSELLGEGVGKIPEPVEKEIESMILLRLQGSKHYKDFINDI